MARLSRSMMQVLQRYTPEYKEEVLDRSERTWRPDEANMSKSPNKGCVEESSSVDAELIDTEE